MVEPWGYHAIFTVSGCDPEALANKTLIERWLENLVERIDMKAFGKPVIEHFATHSVQAVGYSAAQLIETSLIAAHFAENIGKMFVDVFSCKIFEEATAHLVTENSFGGKVTSSHWILRD